MAAAMKSMPLDRDESRYDRMGMDDNPFDSLYTSPTPAEKAVRDKEVEKSRQIQKRRSREMMVDEEEGINARRSTDIQMDMPPFRPALIDFHRKSDATATPGSVDSEASFEGAAPGDYFRMYGYSPVDLSTYTDVHSPYFRSTFQPPPSTNIGPDSPLDHPSTRISTISTATDATITSISSGKTISSLPSYPSSSTTSTLNSPIASHVSVAGLARMSRPSLLRPRPRKRPYETGGVRQRETSGARGISFGEERTEMQDDGRSVSEVMVAMAGLRCQRGRAVRG